MRFIELQIAYPVRHPIYVEVGAILAVEENRINENSQGSIIHIGDQSSFIVEESLREVFKLICP